MNDRGIALVSVLLCLLVSLVLAATMFFAWFVDAQAGANDAAGDDALHIAEAGVQHLWAVLEPAPAFERELAWPGGAPPFGVIVGFPEPPRTYRVRVSAGASDRLSVVSQGTSHRGTRRAVEATFARGPFRPPAAMIVAPGTTLGEVAGAMDASGAGRDPEVPAIGSEARAEAVALRAVGGSFAAAAVVGPSGLGDALGPLRAAASVTYDAPQSGGVWGDEAAPIITRLVGDAEISGTVSAVGIVIADAPLRVRGRLELHGLLLAPAGLDVTGELAIHGVLWIATDFRLSASGAIALVDSSAALGAARRAGGDVLPLPPMLAAWRESW